MSYLEKRYITNFSETILIKLISKTFYLARPRLKSYENSLRSFHPYAHSGLGQHPPHRAKPDLTDDHFSKDSRPRKLKYLVIPIDYFLRVVD